MPYSGNQRRGLLQHRRVNLMDDYSKALRTALERRRRAGRRADVFGVLDMASTKDLLRRTIRRVRGRGSRQRSSKPDSSAEGSRVVSSPGAPNTSGLRWAGCASLFHSALTEEREMPVIQFQTPAVALLTVGDGPGVGHGGEGLAELGNEDVPGGSLQGQPRPAFLAVPREEIVCLEDLPPAEWALELFMQTVFSVLPGHFGAKKGLLSRFRQVVAPLRRVVRRLRRALAALRRVVLALRRALAALRRVVRALRRALAALRRVVLALRRALAALRRVVQPLRRVVAALRPALFHGFDALQRLPEQVLGGE
jgi:hypothetical protein